MIEVRFVSWSLLSVVKRPAFSLCAKFEEDTEETMNLYIYIGPWKRLSCS